MASAAGRCVAALRGALTVRAAAPSTSASFLHRRLKSTWHVPSINVEVAGAAQPRVDEKLVSVTFVNYSGERTTLPGRVGDTLYTVARRYKFEDVDSECVSCLPQSWLALPCLAHHSSSFIFLYRAVQRGAAAEAHLQRLCTRRVDGTNPSTEKEPPATFVT